MSIWSATGFGLHFVDAEVEKAYFTEISSEVVNSVNLAVRLTPSGVRVRTRQAGQTLEGSFSAVSMPNFATEDSFESS